jgi:hypothetical protein
MNQQSETPSEDFLPEDFGDNLSREPDLKDLISTDEAARLQDRSFEEIMDLKERGEIPSEASGARHLPDREDPEDIQTESESSLLKADYGDQGQ